MIRLRIFMLQGVIKMCEDYVRFETDDLIYNRYDIIYSKYDTISYEFQGHVYCIMYHINNKYAYINLWGKELPQALFERIIDRVLNDKNIVRLSLLRCKNDYNNLLEKTNDIILPLPDNIEQLIHRLSAKHRYNLYREKRILKDRLGEIHVVHYYRDSIPDGVVNKYYLWKNESHGTVYELSETDYLDTYHVTDAVAVMANDRMIGIAFVCVVENTAYFENFSYDQRYKELSIGFITYELVLEYLINRRVQTFYLGGGDYGYKRHFGAIESVAFSGHLYSQKAVEAAKQYLEERIINQVVIYGLGKYGHEFIRMVNSNYINIIIKGGIDRKKKVIENIRTYTVDEEYPYADAAIITMNKKNEDIEMLLKNKYKYVIYMKDLFEIG